MIRSFPRRLPHGFLLPLKMALLLACLVCFASPGRAQTGVYGTFDASDFQTPNVGWQYGYTLGLYHDFLHVPFLGVGVDTRFNQLGSDDTKVYSGLLGPRLQLRPHVVPLMPYVEGLIGFGHARVGEGFARTDRTGFEYAGVVGVDWTILPRIDWRVVEFSAGHVTRTAVKPMTWKTGLVLRLP